MDFGFSREEEAFRLEVREFIRGNLSPYERVDFWVYSDAFVLRGREFLRRLGERGWLCVTWPREYGGLGEDGKKQWILIEELGMAGAPRPGMNVGYVGPSILLYGTEEQKRFFLPRIARNEIHFCQGFTEPDSGSDLASLRTLAIDRGDHFVIRGRKPFTSFAHRSDYCYLLARTDPEAGKYRGLSLFLVDMKTPGIEVQPIRDTFGGYFFCEVFFDDVKIPKECLLGEKNRGWEEAMRTLEIERVHFGGGLFIASSCLGFLYELLDHIGKIDEFMKIKFSEIRIELEVARLMALRALWKHYIGEPFGIEASMSKLFSSELSKRLSVLALDTLGLSSLKKPGEMSIVGRAYYLYLGCPSETIGAGTSEIQRNIISMRGLGLPRG